MMISEQFQSKEALEARLVADVLSALTACIEERGEASILFSGGSTPQAMLNSLAEADFDWRKVKVGLVDDRMVSIAVSASNSNMIHANFLDRIEGGKPSYYPLVFHCEDKIRNMIMAMDSAVNFGIPDIVVLGMGGDGHFASLFPNDTSSNLGLDIQFPNPILYTIAPVQPNFRISYSWSQLRKARFHFIHITGDSKWEVIAQHSTRQNDLPIDVVLRDQQINPVLYWAS